MRASPRARSCSGSSPSATRSRSTSRCARSRRRRPPSSCPRRTPGTVTELLFEAGTMVDVGTPIITIDVGGGAAAPAAGSGAARPRPPRRRAGRRPDRRRRAGRPHRRAGRLRPAEHRGPPPPAPRRRHGGRAGHRARSTELPGADYGSGGQPPPLLPTAPDAGTKPVRHGGLEVGRQAEAHALRGDAATADGVAHGRGRLRPLAKPPVRKYAKDLGVDLTTPSPAPAPAASSPAPTSTPRPPAPARPTRRSGGLRCRVRSGGGAADPDQGRAQAHRRRDGGQRLHRAARHGVPHRRRDPDDEAAPAARRPAGAGRRQGQPAAVRGQGAAARRPPAPDGQQLAGTRRPRRSWSRTT